MLSVDIDRILVGKNTQIRLFTDHRNWVQSPTPQAPAFAAPSGLTIVAQEILDDHTALLTVNPTTPNSLVTLLDSMNNEAVTLKCWNADQFAAAGEVSQTDDVDPADQSNNPIDDGYWDSDEGSFGGGLL